MTAPITCQYLAAGLARRDDRKGVASEPWPPTEPRQPTLPPFREAPAVIPTSHAWKIICASIGFQLGLLVLGNTKAVGLGALIVVLGTAAGIALGAWVDRPRRKTGLPSGLRHLFVLLFQFALLFAWLKAWATSR